MKRSVFALALAASLAAGAAWAQPYTPNERGVTMGHWHLNSADVEANKKIFAAMGGNAVKAGDFEVVRFPGVVVMLHLRAPAAPSTGGTDGTVVNHVGLHRAERAGAGRQVEGRGRAGAAGKQQQARSSLGDHA